MSIANLHELFQKKMEIFFFSTSMECLLLWYHFFLSYCVMDLVLSFGTQDGGRRHGRRVVIYFCDCFSGSYSNSHNGDGIDTPIIQILHTF